jgi:hypothetical protein
VEKLPRELASPTGVRIRYHSDQHPSLAEGSVGRNKMLRHGSGGGSLVTYSAVKMLIATSRNNTILLDLSA